MNGPRRRVRASPAGPDPGADGTTAGRRNRAHWNLVLLWLGFLAATAAVLNAGMRIELGAGVTTGLVLALVLLPLWLPTAAAHRHYVGLLGLTVVSAASGIWLTVASSARYETSWSLAVQNSALLAGTVLGAGLILWVRPVLSEWQIGMLFGLGLLTEAGTVPGLDNPWKYQWAMPVAVLALAAAQAVHSRVLGVLVLFGLGAVSAAEDSRSLTGMFVVAGLLLVVQALPLPSGMRTMGAGRVVLLVAALGLAAYWLFTRLALSGVLGLATRLRTEEQTLRAGSVLLGGRPEMAATAGLLVHRPEGFGSGTVLDPAGIAAAQEAMGRLNYDPDNGYVYNYMFGRSLELHSGVGDLWALFGVPGLVLAVLLVRALVDSLARLFSARAVSSLQGATLLFTLWTMFFGPLYTVAPLLALCLGLMLVPHGQPRFLGTRRRAPAGPAAEEVVRR